MSTLFNKSKNPSNKGLRRPESIAPSTNALPVSLSQNGRYVLLSDDIVYSILTAASKMIKSDLDRRETLITLCRVCRVWSRAAQSLLFRHVFIQIRSSMMALLKVIDHKTERGRRLAGSIQAATIRLSRFPENKDPPSLPMIHPRHIPVLLCHVPNLCTLNLTTGWETFNPKIIRAISRGPQITALTLGYYNHNGIGSLVSQMLINDTNPWPLLESVTIQHTDRSVLAYTPEETTPPKIRLTQVAINYQTGGSFEEFHWLTQYSKETLTHVSLVSGAYNGSPRYLGHPNIKNVRSLTLGHMLWTDDLLDTLHTFDKLKELRFVSFIQLQRPFPSNLPDTIEHLLVTAPFLPVPISEGLNPVTPDMGRPSLLKSFTAIVVEQPAYAHEIFTTGEMWAKEYARYCESDGIMTEIRRTAWCVPEVVAKSPFIFKPSGSDVPLRIRQSNGKFNPTPSQLELTDFHVILGGRKVAEESTSNGPTARASPLTRSGKTALARFASIRGLASSWTRTRKQSLIDQGRGKRASPSENPNPSYTQSTVSGPAATVSGRSTSPEANM